MVRSVFRSIKKLFGVYETGHEYWISRSKIKIQPSFKRSRIGDTKYSRKWMYYKQNGKCESAIKLRKDFLLVDGYSSYVILGIAEGRDAKVPVYFVD